MKTEIVNLVLIMLVSVSASGALVAFIGLIATCVRDAWRKSVRRHATAICRNAVQALATQEPDKYWRGRLDSEYWRGRNDGRRDGYWRGRNDGLRDGYRDGRRDGFYNGYYALPSVLHRPAFY